MLSILVQSKLLGTQRHHVVKQLEMCVYCPSSFQRKLTSSRTSCAEARSNKFWRTEAKKGRPIQYLQCLNSPSHEAELRKFREIEFQKRKWLHCRRTCRLLTFPHEYSGNIKSPSCVAAKNRRQVSAKPKGSRVSLSAQEPQIHRSKNTRVTATQRAMLSKKETLIYVADSHIPASSTSQNLHHFTTAMQFSLQIKSPSASTLLLTTFP